MRAFLSHSSVEKALVSSVAKELGRQLVVFDEYEFKTGEDFREAIRQGLAKASVFVLFASKAALLDHPKWVAFEIDEAELLKIEGALSKILVFIVDQNVTHRDLPMWLQRSRVRSVASPKLIAREILHCLVDTARPGHGALFVGRSRELDDAQKLIIPVDGSAAPRAFLLFGLTGIGRRTLCNRIASDLLSFLTLAQIRLEEGDELSDIATKLADEVMPVGSSGEFTSRFNELQSADSSVLIERVRSYFLMLIQNGSLPTLVDEGGFLRNDGFIQPSVRAILDAIHDDPELYLCVVSQRRPAPEPIARERGLPSLRVSELKNDEVKRLVVLDANRRNIRLNQYQVGELADYIKGYPPAVFYAIELVKHYGADIVIADKSKLVDFRASRFLRLLSEDKLLNEKRKEVLAILSYYSPLTLRLIGRLIDQEAEELSDTMSYLLDCAFVVPDDGYGYRLSDPLVDAVFRAFKGLTINHAHVGDVLKGELENLEPDEPRLELSRSYFRARTLSGARTDKHVVGLVSDTIRLSKRFYHSRDYERAVELGRIALEQRPNSSEVRSYVARALVHLERYEEAAQEIDRVRDLGDVADAYFLKGFMARRRHRFAEAIEAYEESLRRGRSGGAIHRELAVCYFGRDDAEKAKEHIDIAQASDRDNRFVVDLQILIATKLRDEESARAGLELLSAVDEEPFVEHRRSTVEYAFGNSEKAYEHAVNAVRDSDRPTVAMMSQVIKCAIDTNELDVAERYLNELDQHYPRTHHDIRVGLRCKWETANGQLENALGTWNRLREKDLPVHLALKAKILHLLISVSKSNDSKVRQYRSDLEALNARLAGFDLQLLDKALGSES